MAWYRDGTVRVTNGSATVTGNGTLWGDNKQGIGPGQMLLVPAAGTVQVYEILRVDSNTQLTLKDNFVGATAAASVYAIPSFYTDSVPDFARRLSAQLSYYQSQMDGWQQIMTGTGSITLTAPNGQNVTISSFKKLTDDMDGKASTNDPRLVNNAAFNTNNQDTLLGLMGPGNMVKAFRNNAEIPAPWDMPDSSPSLFIRTGDTFAAISFSYASPKLKVFTGYANFGWAQTYEIWHTRNTTVDGNGFIKKASPIARLSSNPSEMQPDFLKDFTLAGVVAVNEEARGVSGQRISEGVYVVKGAIGLAKEGWTIEVPQDVNGNRLIFVETEVADSGDITVSTFKRRFDPESAMIVAGDPMDIPEGRWVDLRLKMPQKLQVLDPVSVE